MEIVKKEEFMMDYIIEDPIFNIVEKHILNIIEDLKSSGFSEELLLTILIPENKEGIIEPTIRFKFQDGREIYNSLLLIKNRWGD